MRKRQRKTERTPVRRKKILKQGRSWQRIKGGQTSRKARDQKRKRNSFKKMKTGNNKDKRISL